MPSRHMRHLRWVPTPPPAPGSAPPAGGEIDETPIVDLVLTPRDQTTYLLHIGAEVEHALLVQYLYSAYSLGGTDLSDEQRRLVQKWRSTILSIARQEMAHLITVQNMLTAIGSPASFEREDFPLATELLPFPFELERLTKKTIGKYVLAEMPDKATIARLGLDTVIADLQKYVGVEDSAMVHRVGKIYQHVSTLIAPDPREGAAYAQAVLAASAVEPASLRFQVRPEEWGLGYKDLLILTAVDRNTLSAAIQQIDAQGEGAGHSENSHFERFLEMYNEFPDEQGWQPARNVATNPTTDPSAPASQQITNDAARLWAGLFNLRYRMLLMFLSHAYRLESPLDPGGRTPRGLLVTWTFGEMYNLRSIAEILMDLPLQDDLGVRAGPPFEMPYSLALPARDSDCWRLHRDLLHSSQRYIEQLRRAGTSLEGYLQGLSSADVRALAQVDTVIGG